MIMPMFKHIKESPFQSQLPDSMFFRVAHLPAEATYHTHTHQWGEFVYAYSGLIELTLANSHYLVPKQYGFWLPPNVEHTGFNHNEASHCSLYIDQSLCKQLPNRPCALMMNNMTQSILEYLRHTPPVFPYSEETKRLLLVLADQLALAPSAKSYLPFTADPSLLPVLNKLQEDPANNQSIAELAKLVFSTERTLIRRSQKLLGMSLTDWRQRQKIIKALPMLEDNKTVEHVALELGYSSASAFIVMFRHLMGMTPTEYKKQQQVTH